MARKRNAASASSSLPKEEINHSILEMLHNEDDDDDDDVSWLKDAPNFSQPSVASSSCFVLDGDTAAVGNASAAAVALPAPTDTAAILKLETELTLQISQSTSSSSQELSESLVQQQRALQIAQATHLDRFQHLNSVDQLCWYKYAKRRGHRSPKKKNKNNIYETNVFEYYPCRIAHPDEGKLLHFTKNVDTLIQYVHGHVFDKYDKVSKSCLIPFYGLQHDETSSSSTGPNNTGDVVKEGSDPDDQDCTATETKLKNDAEEDKIMACTSVDLSLNSTHQKRGEDVDGAMTTTTPTDIQHSSSVVQGEKTWCPILLEALQQRRNKENKMNLVDILAEQLFLGHVLNWVRTKEQAVQQQKEQEQQYKLDSSPEEEEKGGGVKEGEGTDVLDSEQNVKLQVEAEEEEVESTVLQVDKKKLCLKAGCIIGYYPTISRHGDARYYTTATILSVDASNNDHKLVLDNSQLLPKNHKVSLLSYLHRGKRIDIPKPPMMEMSNYSFKSSSISKEVNHGNATRYAIEAQAKDISQKIQKVQDQTMNFMSGGTTTMDSSPSGRKRRHSTL